MKVRKQILAAIMAWAMLVLELPGSIGELSVQAADSPFAGEEWYDQIAVVEVNREPARAYFIPYESAEKALINERSVLDLDAEESVWKMSLNGTWKFKFAQNPAEREKNLTGEEAASYEENWDTKNWDDIKVPGSIQAIKDEEGNFKYEKPIYTNQSYPWQNYEEAVLGEYVTAPTVRNSVGQYKRTFTIPKDWDGREVFLSFEGVESAFYLYVNGKCVGYAEDSYTTDEFNITEYLKEGENNLAVEVYRWSTGSYLENQDFIRYSGIFRNVNLYSKDKVELRDIFIKTDLDEDYQDAVLTLDATVRNLGLDTAAGKEYKVTAELYDGSGAEKVWQEPLVIPVIVPEAKKSAAEKADDEGETFTGSREVLNPQKWFADTPNLYMLLIELKDENDNTVETVCQRVGFREIDKADINEQGQEQMQINGEKIMFRGTNRHETDLDDGRAITREDIKEDLTLMKQFNVNAIRTSHYPNNPYMYGLADEIGIYICDETNAESHRGATHSDIPSGFPVWNTSVMDRTKNMVERDKNHPSVVIWSLGNEATYRTYEMNENYCFYNSARWILQRDPSRMRKYERDNRYEKGDRRNSMVDIYSSQYWSVSAVESYVANITNKAPYIQSEYAHAMGNALGNFKEYWDVFRSYPNGQGGFIWDWIDQSMRTKAEGEEQFYFGYGGDWGETVTDNDFCANGLVFADRTPSPELYEVKKVHQEISFYDDGKASRGEIRIVNEFLNTNLNQYDVSWTLKEDDVLLAEGKLTEEQKDLKPQQEKTIELVGFPDVSATEGSDYVLTLSVTLREDQAWAGLYSGHEGDEIAFEEFELLYDASKKRPMLDAADMNDLLAEDSDDVVTITGSTDKNNGESFEIAIDKTTGYISSYQVGGKTLLKQGPVPNYYRAPVSNDPYFNPAMKNAAENMVINQNGISVWAGKKVVLIHAAGMINGLNSPEVLDYTIYGNGRIEVSSSFTPSEGAGEIARIGMKMTVAEGYENLTYYGNGPQENYSDRNTGTKLGVYTSTVDEQFERKYIKPQECGNRTGVRWTALTNDEGIGIMVSSDSAMESGALHYRAEDLDSYRHLYQVPKQNNTILTVDLMQRGLGNASCGPGPLGQYIIRNGVTYNQTFSIQPLTAKAGREELMAKSKEIIKPEAPLSGIKVAGKEIGNFSVNQTEYTYTLLAGSFGDEIPQVEAVKASEEAEVTVTQAKGVPGTAVIHTVSATGIVKDYRVSLRVANQLYISDMNWKTNSGGYFENALDACSCGAEIAVYADGQKKNYKKGVGCHAPAEAAVDLTGMGEKMFEATIGISACQTIESPANVNFVVKGDGMEIFRKNDVKSGKSYPVSLDVSRVKILSLIVETNGEDACDHAVWADAKIVRKPILISEVEAAETEKTLTEGEKYSIRASVKPENTTETQDLIYSSSNRAVAEVDAAGNVTAVSEGSAVITVASAAHPEITAFVTIKVSRKEDENKADSSALKDALNHAETKDLSSYTEESAAQFRAALKAAKEILENSKATQEEIDEALKMLKAAEEGLEEKSISEPDTNVTEGKTFDKGNFCYKVTGEAGQTVQVTALKNKKLTAVKINNSVSFGGRNYKITSVASSAFKGNKTIKTMLIGTNVTEIGSNAFAGCTRLKKATFGRKVTNIGEKAFFGCKKLKNLIFKGVKAPKIGSQAFQGIRKKYKLTISKKMKAKQRAVLRKRIKKA